MWSLGQSVAWSRSTPGVCIPVCARGAQVWRKTSKLISSFPRGWKIKDRQGEPRDLERAGLWGKRASCTVGNGLRGALCLPFLYSEQQVKAVHIQPLPWGCVMTTENGEQHEQEVAWTDLKVSDMWGWVKRTSVEKCLAWRYNHQLKYHQAATENCLGRLLIAVLNEVNKYSYRWQTGACNSSLH